MPLISKSKPRRISVDALRDHKGAALENQSGQMPGIIFPIYKKIVGEVSQTYPAHTRLPSVRELAKGLEISLVTAQRVVKELAEEGVLYSRPKAGIYVAEREEESGPSKGLSTHINPYFQSTCRVATNSVEDYQRQLWTGLAGSFEQRYPNIRPELHFADGAEDLQEADVYERLNWNVGLKSEKLAALDLREYLPSRLANRCTPEGLLPLYFRSNFLFFNRELLESCGIPSPDYRTFREQHEYLESALPKLRENGFEGKPCAVQQPITLLGTRDLESFFEIAASAENDPTTTTAFTDAVQSVIDYCRMNLRAPGFQNPRAAQERQRFMKGKTSPFFLGHSVDYWLFKNHKLPFPLECYPTLCSDDTLFLWPMVGVVSKRSERPAEGIRFLTFLLGETAQEQFSDTGNYPSDADSPDLPATTADPGWLKAIHLRSKPMRLSASDRSYLALNILNNELWHALLDHAPVEQAVDEAVQLGRAYLKEQRLASVQSTAR